MDAHYDAQIARNQDNYVTHGGPARQFGSGAADLGALAVRIGRCTLPLLRKYALPFAKTVGWNLVSAAIPEIGEIISGKKRLKTVAKTSIKKSLSKSIADTVAGTRSPHARGRKTAASRGRIRAAVPPARRPTGGSHPKQTLLSANKQQIKTSWHKSDERVRPFLKKQNPNAVEKIFYQTYGTKNGRVYEPSKRYCKSSTPYSS